MCPLPTMQAPASLPFRLPAHTLKVASGRRPEGKATSLMWKERCLQWHRQHHHHQQRCIVTDSGNTINISSGARITTI